MENFFNIENTLQKYIQNRYYYNTLCNTVHSAYIVNSSKYFDYLTGSILRVCKKQIVRPMNTQSKVYIGKRDRLGYI